MRHSFKFNPDFSHKQLNIVSDLSWHLSKLHNIVNYEIKNKQTIKPLYTKIENNFKSNWHCNFLHSHNRQQLFRQLSGDWKSYFTSLKDYENNPGKYKNKPGPPGFKNINKNPAEIIFTKPAIRTREGKILLSLSKEIKETYQVKALKFQLPAAVESLIKLKHLQQIRIKRRNYITNYLHKASFKIIKIALDKKVSKIIIGDMKDIKQKMKYNKSFVQIPIQRLTDLIEYKAKLAGIKVIKINESYTSGCSALDLEKINQDNYDESRRIKRGLFVSNKGLEINADVNGALNIMRKYEKECIPKLVKQAKDNGVVFPPSRLRVA